MTTLLLALSLFSTPINVDKLDAKTANKIAAKGATNAYVNLLHNTLKSIYLDAEQGYFKDNFYTKYPQEAEYLRGKLAALNYGVTVVLDGETYIITVRWD